MSVCLAGFSKVNLNARVGLQLSGFIFRQQMPSMDLYDPLYVRSVALRQGKTTLIVLSFDLLALDWDFVRRVRKSISDQLCIPYANVILCCTHTHSAPAAVYLVKCGQVNSDFLRSVHERSLLSAHVAIADLEPVKIGFASVELNDESYNRRRILENGSVVMNQFPLARVVRTGPIDEEFGIIKFCARNRTKGVLLNFGAHPCTVCEQGITADYPGLLCRLTEEVWHPSPVAIFWLGAAGNVNPPLLKMDYEEMQRNGRRLFEKIKPILLDTQSAETANLSLRSSVVNLPLQETQAPEELCRKREAFAALANGQFEGPGSISALHEIANILNTEPGQQVDHSKAAFLANAMVEYYQNLLDRGTSKPWELSVPFEISVVRVGRLRLIFVSAELFAETAIDLKRTWPFSWIISVSHGAGNVGYLPTRVAFAEGGYESTHAHKFYNLPSPLAEESEEIVKQKITQILTDMKENIE